ncbi:MAG: hypothetical protein LBE48_02240 [Methanomassiliicoccaceae archaeon]|jgi:arginyl-tRNA synthetase|nr:hypothetical protein [Methanomassiliicoccaceae archaeon]
MSIFNTFTEDVKDAVKDALSKMGADGPFETEIPSTDAADLDVPCFLLAKSLKRSPADIANVLAS